MKKAFVIAAVVALANVGVFAQTAYTTTTAPYVGPGGGGDGSPVPEPATLALLVAGTAGVGLKAWRQKRSRL